MSDPTNQQAGAAPQDQQTPIQTDPWAVVSRTPQDQQTSAQTDPWAVVSRTPATQPVAESEKPSALSRFGTAFAAPFKSIYHGVADAPSDVNETIAHAQGGQGGLIAFRAAKKLVDAHTAMANAKPGLAFQQAVVDFQNAAIDSALGNRRDAMMHGVSGGLNVVGGIEPTLQPTLERPRALTEGAATGGDFATPLGSTAADVAIAAGTYGAGRGLTAIHGAAEAAEGAGEAAELGETAATAPKSPNIVKQVWKGEKVAQPEAQSALRTGVNAGSKEGGVSTVQNHSLRTIVEQPTHALEAQAKSNYSQIDQAAGTDFKALNEKLENTEYQIRQLTETEEDLAKAEQLEKARTATIDKIAAAKQQALDNGIDPKLLDKADAQYKQASALKDLETKVFKNPNIVRGNSAMGTEETVNVDGAVKELQKLHDKIPYGGSRLEQALGEEGATNLLKDLYAAQRTGIKALSRQQMLGKILKWSGVGTGIVGGAYELLKK